MGLTVNQQIVEVSKINPEREIEKQYINLTVKNQTVFYSDLSCVECNIEADKNYAISLILDENYNTKYEIALLNINDNNDIDYIYSIGLFENESTPFFTFYSENIFNRIVLIPKGVIKNNSQIKPTIAKIGITELTEIDLGGKVVQLGIQASTGTRMCINGENINMDKTGIYEIYNGYVVNSLAIASKVKESVIIDYVREEDV